MQKVYRRMKISHLCGTRRKGVIKINPSMAGLSAHDLWEAAAMSMPWVQALEAGT